MNKKNKIIMVGGISVVSVIVLVIIMAKIFASGDAKPENSAENTKSGHIGSAKPGQSSEAVVRPGTTHIKSHDKKEKVLVNPFSKLTPKKRAEIAKGAAKILKERMDKFFAMSEGEQNKYLDNEIAKMSKINRKLTQKEKEVYSKQIKVNMNQVNQILYENIDSNTRAKMMEYTKRLQERMKRTR